MPSYLNIYRLYCVWLFICPLPHRVYSHHRAAADAADMQARELRLAAKEREHAARAALLEAKEEELRQAVALRSAELLDAHQQVLEYMK